MPDPQEKPAAASPAAEPSAPQFSFKKKLLFSAILVFAFAVLVEAGVRVGFFLGDNFSPYYLTFGFIADVESHSANHEGYTTFQPNSVYHYKTSRGRTVDMRINSSGFRGADWVKPKPAGVFRIVTLGESSTFGLANDDRHTYPATLDSLLQARMQGRRVEVLNLGIPHYRSNHILALARAELQQLQPDVVTVYAGYNNSMVFREASNPNIGFRAKDWLKSHSVTYRALHPYVATALQKVSRGLNRDLVGMPSLGLPVEMPAARVDALRAAAVAEYEQDLDSIIAVAQRSGARVVLMTQTFSFARLPTVRLGATIRPYNMEVAYVDSMLKANGSIPAPYATALIHKAIIDVFRNAAQTHHLTLVDGIALLDTDRDSLMASFVHLTDIGTRRLAIGIESTFVSQGVIPLPAGAAPPVVQRQLARTPSQRPRTARRV